MQSSGDSVTVTSREANVVAVNEEHLSSHTPIELQKRSNTSFHNVRYLILTLCGIATGTMLFTRLTITVAIVSMVNHTHLYLAEHPNSTVEDFFDPDYVEVGIFNWTNEVQQTVIAGYMIAYTLPQVMGGKIGMRFGMRKSISVCLLVCALSSLLTPIVAYWGWQWVLALRLLNGLGASPVIPIVIGTIENWMPYQDSALGLSLMQFVQTFIYIATPLISGELASIHWEWAFYIPGVFSIAFVIVWWFIARDTPDSCPFISQREIDIIKGELNNDKNSLEHTEEKKKPARTDLPWYFVFNIKSFYFLLAAWILYCSTFGGLLFLLPTYFHKVLKISIKENGFYSFIIQLGVMFSMLWPGPVISYLRSHFKLSLTASRRIIVVIYTLMTIATLLYIAAYHENQILVICINRFFHMTNDTIITATLMSQFGREGLSGMAYSVINTFGNFGSMIFCWAAGRYLDYTGESRDCWSWIFATMAIFNIIHLFVYTCFIRSEPIKLKDEAREIKNSDKV